MCRILYIVLLPSGRYTLSQILPSSGQFFFFFGWGGVSSEVIPEYWVIIFQDAVTTLF